jgi:hypothetical protein
MPVQRAEQEEYKEKALPVEIDLSGSRIVVTPQQTVPQLRELLCALLCIVSRPSPSLTFAFSKQRIVSIASTFNARAETSCFQDVHIVVSSHVGAQRVSAQIGRFLLVK